MDFMKKMYTGNFAIYVVVIICYKLQQLMVTTLLVFQNFQVL